MAYPKAIGQLFDIDRSVVTKHLQNVFADGAVIPSDGWVSPGAGCTNYCTTNIGWVYHKWDEDLDLSDVEEVENGDHLIHGFGFPDSTYKPNDTYVPAKCASTGGYYRLAFYAIRDFTGDSQHGGIRYSKMQQIGVPISLLKSA